MPKHFLLTALFALSLCIVNAQKNSKEFGFHGGINFNSANGNGINRNYRSMQFGFNAGGSIKINCTNNFGVKIIFNYEQYGWAYRSLFLENASGTDIGKGDIIYKLNYLNFPVLAEYVVGNKIKFYANAGVFVGFLIKNERITKVKEGLNGGAPSTSSSSLNYSKAINYGIAAGFGIQMSLTHKIKLNINLRNDAGLANINKPLGSTSNSVKTNSLSISPGLTFPL